MEIKELESQEIEKLNEWQKDFYSRLNLFIDELESKYFDVDKSKYEVSCSKKRCDLLLRLVTKNNSLPEIRLYIQSSEIYVCLDGWHENLEYDKVNFDMFFENIKKLLIFMLSESCKLVIFKSNNKPYKWNLYGLENSSWKFYSSTGLLFHNLFGRRSREEKQLNVFKQAVYPKELFAGKEGRSPK